ncbi:MAG TPA: hypothetical protein PKA55_09685 [Rhodoblastus sp.]|nr:hypothetical protein [Rhodoblastus sp.]
MTIESRRSFLVLAASALGAAALAGDASAQTYYEGRPVRRRRSVEPDDGPRRTYCRPMCAEDTTPCDSPAEKAVDGRCSSPTAGSVR